MFGTIFVYGLFILWGYLVMATLRFCIIGFSFDERGVEKWLIRHPYHLVTRWFCELKDEETELAFFIFQLCFFIIPTMIFVSLIISGIIPFDFCLFFIFGGCFYWIFAAVYFICQKLLKNNRLFTKSWWQDLVQRLKNYRNILAPKEIFEAKHYQKSLMSLINGYKNEPQLQPILTKVNELVKKELPSLLKRRIQLAKAVTNAKQTIARQEKNGICQGEKNLMNDSESSLQYFQQKQKEVEEKIALILAFLDHSAPRVSRIIDATSAQSDNEAENLIQKIHADLDLLVKSQEEVSRLKKQDLGIDAKSYRAAVQEINGIQSEAKKHQPPGIKI